MHFAKRLERDALKEWADSYIGYKALKKTVKHIESKKLDCLRSKVEFSQVLQVEIAKVSAKYLEQCALLATQLKDLETRPDLERDDVLLRHELSVVVIPLLNKLRSFVALNYTAVVKIVKKWNKQMYHRSSSLDATAMLLGHKVVTGFNISSSSTDISVGDSLCNSASSSRATEESQCCSSSSSKGAESWRSTIDSSDLDSDSGSIREETLERTRSYVQSRPRCETRVGEAVFFTSRKLSELYTKAELLAYRFAPEEVRCSQESLMCAICINVLSNPVVLSCTHHFCFACIGTLAAFNADLSTSEPDFDVRLLSVVDRFMQFDCPVCRKTQVFDEGHVWLDSHLGELVNMHISDDVDRKKITQAKGKMCHDDGIATSVQRAKEMSCRDGEKNTAPIAQPKRKSKEISITPCLSPSEEASRSSRACHEVFDGGHVWLESHLGEMGDMHISDDVDRRKIDQAKGNQEPCHDGGMVTSAQRAKELFCRDGEMATPVAQPKRKSDEISLTPCVSPSEETSRLSSSRFSSESSDDARTDCMWIDIPTDFTPSSSHIESQARTTFPKALVVVVEACRPDAVLMSRTPWIDCFITGEVGAYAFSNIGQGSWPSTSATTAGQADFLCDNLSQWEEIFTAGVNPSDANVGTVFDMLNSTSPGARSLLISSSIELADVVAAHTKQAGGSRLEPMLVMKDHAAMKAAEDHIRGGSSADVVVVQLSELMATGMQHGFGLNSGLYRNAITEVDGILARLYAAMEVRQSEVPNEDWLMMVVGTVFRQPSHISKGSQLPEAATEGCCFMAGNSVCEGEMKHPTRRVDVAPVLLKHFGVSPRPEWGLSEVQGDYRAGQGW